MARGTIFDLTCKRINTISSNNLYGEIIKVLVILIGCGRISLKMLDMSVTNHWHLFEFSKLLATGRICTSRTSRRTTNTKVFIFDEVYRKSNEHVHRLN